MNPEKQACSSLEKLSKITILSVLPSQIDSSRGIILSTGEVVDLNNYDQYQINQLIKNKLMVYYELLQPKRMLLINPNWEIVSFNSKNSTACIKIYSPSGSKTLSINVNSYITKFT